MGIFAEETVRLIRAVGMLQEWFHLLKSFLHTVRAYAHISLLEASK